MNPNTRTELKAVLANKGVQAVKKIAKENGISRPAHQGKMVVAQLVVKEALNQVEQDARQLVQDLGLSLVVEGRSLLVNDVNGQYIAHAFAWGQLILNLKAWQQNQPQVKTTPAPTPTKTPQQPRNLYLLNNWQPETMAIRLVDDGDNGNSTPTKLVSVQLKDGSCKTVGKFTLGVHNTLFASSGLWGQTLPATEENLKYAMNVMLGRNSITKSNIAEIPFDSVRYLGF